LEFVDNVLQQERQKDKTIKEEERAALEAYQAVLPFNPIAPQALMLLQHYPSFSGGCSVIMIPRFVADFHVAVLHC
jgi:hypothetical protein